MEVGRATFGNDSGGPGVASDVDAGADEDGTLSVAARGARLRKEGRQRLVERLVWLPLVPFLLAGPLPWFAPDLLPVVVALTLQLFLLAAGAVFLVPFVLTSIIASRLSGPLRAVVDEAGNLEVAGPDGRMALPSEAISVAWTRRARAVEVLTQGGDELLIELEDPAESARLVETLRARTQRQRRAYPVELSGPGRRLFRKATTSFFPLSIASMVVWAGPAAAPALGVGALLAWLGARRRPRLRFGADGVSVEGRFAHRYVPYREIAQVKAEMSIPGFSSLQLRLVDGSTVHVCSMVEQNGRAELVRALVQEGVEMAERGERAGAHVAQLVRDVDDEAWKQRLASLAKGAGYRGPAIDAERLFALMRNPAAAADQRIGAALALRQDPSGLARIRVAAEVSAEPDVKAALQELATEELDERRLGKLLQTRARRA